MLFLQLSYFIKTVECQSFTKAAEELYVSQSAISKSIRSLEEDLQTTLIDRTYRKFTLTEQGQVVYEFAKDVLAYFQEKEKEMRKKLQGEDRLIRFGLPPTAGSIFFYSTIFSFQEENPSVDLKIIDLTSTYIVDQLLNNEMDMGVAISPFEDPRFHIHPVYTSEAVLVVGKDHPLANHDKVDFIDLKGEKFLQVKKDFMYHQVFVDYCHQAGFEPNIVFESNQWDLIIELAASSKGVTILPKPLIDNYSSKRIHQIHLENPTFPWSLSIIYLKSKILTESMEKFLSLCIREAKRV